MVWYHKFAFARNLRNSVEVGEETKENFNNGDEEMDDVFESEDEMTELFDLKSSTQPDQFKSRHHDSTISTFRPFRQMSALIETSAPAETTRQFLSSPTASVDYDDHLNESATSCPSLHQPFLPKSVSPTLSSGSPKPDTVTPIRFQYGSLLRVPKSPDVSTRRTTSTSSLASILSASSSISQHRDVPKSAPPTSMLLSVHSSFLEPLAARTKYRSSPITTSLASPVPSMKLSQIRASLSNEQYEQTLLRAAFLSNISSMQPSLEESATFEHYMQSRFLKPIVSPASLRFSPISTLSQNNSRTETDANLINTACGDNGVLEYVSPKLVNGPMSIYGVPISHDKDIYYCEWVNCYTGFSCMNKFINHVNSHCQRRSNLELEYHCQWFGCTRNGNAFDARYKLLVHMRTHTGEKPYQCPTCGKKFSRKDNMKIHVRTHTGEKPCICPHEGCSKAFTNASDRLKHFRTHKEARPYVCKIPGCKKSYTDPSSLRKHIKSQSHCKDQTFAANDYS